MKSGGFLKLEPCSRNKCEIPTLTALGYEEAPSQKLLLQRTGECHASLKVVICLANSPQHRAKSKCVLHTRLRNAAGGHLLRSC
jgi:hypothetical protein